MYRQTQGGYISNAQGEDYKKTEEYIKIVKGKKTGAKEQAGGNREEAGTALIGKISGYYE